MRLDVQPRVVMLDGSVDPVRLNVVLTQAANQVNNLSEGQVGAVNNAQTAVPTTGTYNVGDFVRNSAPAEAGTVGSKFVTLGWICTASPLTFVQCRTLTGN